VVSLVADLIDAHVIKGGHVCFRLEAKSTEANFTACTLNGRAGYRVDFLVVKPAFLKIGSAHFSMVMGAK